MPVRFNREARRKMHQKIKELSRLYSTNAEIAEKLNSEGFRTPEGKECSPTFVSNQWRTITGVRRSTPMRAAAAEAMAPSTVRTATRARETTIDVATVLGVVPGSDDAKALASVLISSSLSRESKQRLVTALI